MKIPIWIAVCLFAAIVAGCGGRKTAEHAHGHESEHAHGDGHEHEHNDNLLLTAYGDKCELFAEVVPFALGEPSSIIAHFTALDNFKPIKAASVTASLIVGTDGIRQTVEQTSEAGIYRFTLKPVVAGRGQLVFDVRTADEVLNIVVPNVVVYEDKHAAMHAAEEAAVKSSNAIVFTKEQSWKVDFATAEVASGAFGQVIRTAARILPSQTDERIVSAKSSGIVIFADSDMAEGKTAGVNQNLFSIDSESLIDNNLGVRYNEALVEYERAKAEYERKSDLAKDRIVAESELLKARAEFANAKTVFDNLQRNAPAGRLHAASPIAGFVRQTFVRNGEYVEAGQPVVLVAASRDLLVKAELQPKYFPLLASISSANICTLGDKRVYSLEELNGSLLSYGKSVSEDAPLVPVIFRIKNVANFLPGSFVEIFIKTRSSAQALTVSVEAIAEEMGNYFVFVQLTPELFEKRPVKTGVTDGARTEIIDGLAAGERIVTKGAIFVKLAQNAGALDAHSGHAH